jgi:thiol-disulfide isomerase/thioredoxin
MTSHVARGPSYRRSVPAWAAAGLLAAGFATTALALDLGDDAPELEVGQWVKGGPVTLSAGKAYVVSFWATWSDDAKKSLDVLQKFQEQHATKLVVLAVADEPAEDVKTFLADKKYALAFAVDQNRNTTGVYRIAAGAENKLPYAFVVTQQGKVAWHGDPNSTAMAEVVEEVVAGKFDVARARLVRDRRAAMRQAMRGSRTKLEKAIDELLEVEPGNAEAVALKLQVLRAGQDPAKYHEFVKGRIGELKEAVPLNEIAWSLLTDTRVAWREVALGHQAAKRAVELSEHKDGSILDTYARAFYVSGLLEQAVEHQKRALALEDTDDKDGAKRKHLEATLAYYEACLALQKQLRAGSKGR